MIKGIPCPHGKNLIQAGPWSKSCQKCEHWHGNRDTGWCCCDLQDDDNIEALYDRTPEAGEKR